MLDRPRRPVALNYTRAWLVVVVATVLSGLAAANTAFVLLEVTSPGESMLDAQERAAISLLMLGWLNLLGVVGGTIFGALSGIVLARPLRGLSCRPVFWSLGIASALAGCSVAYLALFLPVAAFLPVLAVQALVVVCLAIILSPAG